ncbi:MAG: hypothetical protein IJ236_09740 [Oscillospiraceae bacterium]|nr:hypothetical protein [Oscillospiraceae bacterium]
MRGTAMMLGTLQGMPPIRAADAETVFYVSPDGSDAGDGSAEAPFRTLEAARDAVRGAGGNVTVYLHGGTTWNENIVCTRDIKPDGNNLVLLLQQPYGAIAQTPGWGAGFAAGAVFLHFGGICGRTPENRFLVSQGYREVYFCTFLMHFCIAGAFCILI